MIRPVRLTCEIIPGVWGDSRGAMHVDVPARLRLLGIPDTPTARYDVGCMALAELRIAMPRVVLIAHVGGLPQ